MIPDASVTLRKRIPAPPARVFESWTRPEELKRWFAPDAYSTPAAEVDLRVGGRYRIAMQNRESGQTVFASGVYREILPPSRIVFTWTWDHWEDHRESVVTVTFHDVAGGTEVVLTHELLPSQKDAESHGTGWTQILEKCAAALAAR